MKKLGFTLAEVLITLGIVGVVAALTTPALVKNTGTAKIGPALSKFVNSWETACEQLMTDESLETLSALPHQANSDGSGSEKTVLNPVSKYLVMSPTDKDFIAVYEHNSGAVAPNQVQNKKAWQLKDGSTLAFDLNQDTDDYYEPKDAYKGWYGKVYFDINGFAGNNVIGKEVFKFEVDKTGVLVPYGSHAWANLLSTDRKRCSLSGDTGNAWGCTGEIADNNWNAKGVYTKWSEETQQTQNP